MASRATTDGNILAEVAGIGIEGDDTTPCKSLLKNSWGFPVWMKAENVLNEPYVEDEHRTPYDLRPHVLRPRDRTHLARHRLRHEERGAGLADQ